MDYLLASYNNGEEVTLQEDYRNEWSELRTIIEDISEEEITSNFANRLQKGNTEKSISKTLNYLLHDRLTKIEWIAKPYIFKNSKFKKSSWSLDFHKKKVGIEVVFHHERFMTWKLVKTFLASQPNEIQKAFEIKMAIFIFVTEEMMDVGGFDQGIITFEKAKHYAAVLSNFLACPTIFIGLEAPKTFHIKHKKDESKNRNIGEIIRRF